MALCTQLSGCLAEELSRFSAAMCAKWRGGQETHPNMEQLCLIMHGFAAGQVPFLAFLARLALFPLDREGLIHFLQQVKAGQALPYFKTSSI